MYSATLDASGVYRVGYLYTTIAFLYSNTQESTGRNIRYFEIVGSKSGSATVVAVYYAVLDQFKPYYNPLL